MYRRISGGGLRTLHCVYGNIATDARPRVLQIRKPIPFIACGSAHSSHWKLAFECGSMYGTAAATYCFPISRQCSELRHQIECSTIFRWIESLLNRDSFHKIINTSSRLASRLNFSIHENETPADESTAIKKVDSFVIGKLSRSFGMREPNCVTRVHSLAIFDWSIFWINKFLCKYLFSTHFSSPHERNEREKPIRCMNSIHFFVSFSSSRILDASKSFHERCAKRRLNFCLHQLLTSALSSRNR